MKAVLLRRPGPPENLEIAEIPSPGALGEHDMLVRLRAAGVNPVDTKLRARGTYYPDRMPAVLGCDGAGTVERIGASVERFQPGDAVWFCHGGIGGHPGTYAEYAVVRQAYAAHKPDSLSFEEAAAVPLVLITAWEALHDRVQVQAGQRVLVHGGAGGVGHIAVQLARLSGARVAATVGSAENAAFVEALGVERPILHRVEDFIDATMNWTGGIGADIALDTVGEETFARTVAALKTYGDLVTILQPPAAMDWKPARTKNLRIAFELMLTPMLTGDENGLRHHANILREGGRLFDEGKLKVHVDAVLPLEEVAEAHRRIEAGGRRGKIVLSIGG